MIVSILTTIAIVLFIIIIGVAAIISIVALGLLTLFIVLGMMFVAAMLETVVWFIFINIAYGIVWIIDLPFSIVKKLLKWISKGGGLRK